MAHDDLSMMLRTLAATPDDAALRERVLTAWTARGLEVSLDEALDDVALWCDVLEASTQGGVGDALAAEVARVDVAGDVMAVLFGEEPAPVADAVSHEAGVGPNAGLAWSDADAPVAEAVAAEAGPLADLGRAFDEGAVPVAEAVASEAGMVSVTDAVMAAVDEGVRLPEGWASAMLDHALDEAQHALATKRLGEDTIARRDLAALADVGRVLREAVVAEAGASPSLWSPVAHAIGIEDPEAVPGWDGQWLRDALGSEAGSVDVRTEVMGTITRDARAPEPELAPAANPVWTWAAVAVAAAVMLFVVTQVWPPAEAPVFTEREVAFASSGEMHVDRVSYGDNASVFVEVPESDDEPIIIWVDDGGAL